MEKLACFPRGNTVTLLNLIIHLEGISTGIFQGKLFSLLPWFLCYTWDLGILSHPAKDWFLFLWAAMRDMIVVSFGDT